MFFKPNKFGSFISIKIFIFVDICLFVVNDLKLANLYERLTNARNLYDTVRDVDLKNQASSFDFWLARCGYETFIRISVTNDVSVALR